MVGPDVRPFSDKVVVVGTSALKQPYLAAVSGDLKVHAELI